MSKGFRLSRLLCRMYHLSVICFPFDTGSGRNYVPSLRTSNHLTFLFSNFWPFYLFYYINVFCSLFFHGNCYMSYGMCTAVHKYLDTWYKPIKRLIIFRFSTVNSLLLAIIGIKCSAKLILKQRIYLCQSSFIFIFNKQLAFYKIYINF